MEIPYITENIYGIEVKVRKDGPELEMKLGGGTGYYYRLEDIEALYALMIRAFHHNSDDSNKLAAIRKILDS